jgi:hypothetical protein
MLILNLLSVVGCVAAFKGRAVGIERRQAAATKQYTVYTIDQPVCHVWIIKIDFVVDDYRLTISRILKGMHLIPMRLSSRDMCLIRRITSLEDQFIYTLAVKRAWRVAFRISGLEVG